MFTRKRYRLRLPSRTLVLGERTLIMGVLNVTPDSFSDGGKYLDSPSAIARALEMERAGADLLDIGGESTRPGADPVSAEEELARVLPVLEGLRGKIRIPISLDTQKATVAEAGIAAGVEMINDVSALRSDPALGEVIRRRRVALIADAHARHAEHHAPGPVCINVMRDVVERPQGGGRPRHPRRPGKIAAPDRSGNRLRKKVCAEFRAARAFAGAWRGSAIRWSWARREKCSSGGSSRAARQPPWPVEKRLWGTAATVTAAILGGAHIVRVHDVEEMAQVARITDAIAAAR